MPIKFDARTLWHTIIFSAKHLRCYVVGRPTKRTCDVTRPQTLLHARAHNANKLMKWKQYACYSRVLETDRSLMTHGELRIRNQYSSFINCVYWHAQTTNWVCFCFYFFSIVNTYLQLNLDAEFHLLIFLKLNVKTWYSLGEFNNFACLQELSINILNHSLEFEIN